MENFIAFNPTSLHFGRGVVDELGQKASALGKKALLVYGGGSVLSNGSYHDTLEQLKIHGIEVTEYHGIKPNPVYEDVNEAARLGRIHQVDFVVAVGGGSVIDSAKIIAICIADGGDAWDIMSRKHPPSGTIPLLAVLTLAATGTEMNPVAVLQNRKTRQKIGYRNPFNYPDYSFLDPAYTLSVSPEYTSYGIVDLIAHCLEAWFGEGEASLSDRFVVSIIHEAMEFGPALMKDLENYELREKMMWSATCALNNLTIYGRKSADWGVHALGHVLSVLFDTPHGASLSIMYPAWMRVLKPRTGDRILKLGADLFGCKSVDETIQKLEALFSSVGSPIRCSEAGIGDHQREEILKLMNTNQSQGLHYQLSDTERSAILSFAL